VPAQTVDAIDLFPKVEIHIRSGPKATSPSTKRCTKAGTE
jgi:hypothetical protein